MDLITDTARISHEYRICQNLCSHTTISNDTKLAVFLGKICGIGNYLWKTTETYLGKLVKISNDFRSDSATFIENGHGETHNRNILHLMDMIHRKAVEADDADIILTTAHKSKGLEWDNVLLIDDFPKLVENDAPIDADELEPDEFNLIYVAMTRTIHNLRFQKASSIPAFIQLNRKQKPES